MKYLLIIGLVSLGIVLSCTKVKTAKAFPELRGPEYVDSAYWTLARLEQVAKEKADSMRIVDSLKNLGVLVDSNSLFFKKNLLVAYVEVNNKTIVNAGCYTDQDGKAVFDLAMIFAPNINLSSTTGKAYISYNPQVTAIINNGAIRQTQAKGVKVGMTILGNHDDAGFRNFKNFADAAAFAQVVAAEVRRYGLDAIDFDDEYSNSPAWANDSSFVMLISEVKRLLPDKLVMCYLYGGATTSIWNGKRIGDYADVGFTPFYPQIPTVGMGGFPAAKLGASASPTAGGFANPATSINQIKNSGFKGLMLYNITGSASEQTFLPPYISALKGKSLVVVPNCIQ